MHLYNCTKHSLPVDTIPSLKVGDDTWMTRDEDGEPVANRLWDFGLWDSRFIAEVAEHGSLDQFTPDDITSMDSWEKDEHTGIGPDSRTEFLSTGIVPDRVKTYWAWLAKYYVDRTWLMNLETYQAMPIEDRLEDPTRYNAFRTRAMVSSWIASTIWEIEPRVQILPWHHPQNSVIADWPELRGMDLIGYTPDRVEHKRGIVDYSAFAAVSLYASRTTNFVEWQLRADKAKEEAEDDTQRLVVAWLRLDLFEDSPNELEEYLTRAKNTFPEGLVFFASALADPEIWRDVVGQVFAGIAPASLSTQARSASRPRSSSVSAAPRGSPGSVNYLSVPPGGKSHYR